MPVGTLNVDIQTDYTVIMSTLKIWKTHVTFGLLHTQTYTYTHKDARMATKDAKTRLQIIEMEHWRRSSTRTRLDREKNEAILNKLM